MDSNRDKSDDEYSVIGEKGEIGFLDYQNDRSVCNYNPDEEGPVIISVPFPFVDGKPQSVFVGETAADKITIKNTTKEPMELWTKIYASTPEDSFLLSLMPPPSVDGGNSKQEFIGLFNLEDRMLEPGDTLTIWLSCKPTGIGLYTSAVHFDLGYDRIERVVFLLAEDKVSRSLASRKPYSRVARKKKQFDVDVYVPGSRPTRKGERHFRSRLPRYDIPKDIRELIENNQVPAGITAGLSRENYACFFKTLLIIEEIQLEENMRAYNMEAATMKRKGNYLSLVVPGLAEKRPSIVHGDHIFVKDVDADDAANPYQGFVHRVEADEVYLRFAPEFHLHHIEGNLYNVNFTYSRINMRRQYQALDAAEGLATELLFPSESSENRLIETTALLPISANLNEEQMSAVEKILGCRGGAPYVIFGPPGTGKTKTIVEAILQLYRNYKGTRILVCAPSNSAADYLLEKLLTEKAVNVRENEIFRLNAPARQFDDISPDYIRFCFFDEFVFKCPPLKALLRYKIIISTYMGAALLNAEGVDRGHFSHIFLDEAGQASEPESMVPISNLCQMDTVVVLAGDPLQLGPVIFSKKAEACGLGKSYLERLFECGFYCDGDENYVTKLIRNYRCHPDILYLPSTLFYEGELIACKDSTDDTISLLSSVALLPGNNFSVLYFGIQGCDEREGNNPSWFNRIEASKVVEIINKLITRGNLSDADIGVITPYRQQVLKLKKALEDMDMSDVKVGSVEQFQGQEKKVIIVSSVRSTIKHNEFDKTYCLGFLSNPRRFNVAITRAITLLIIVGNPHIVSKDPNWNELLWYCVDNESYQGCVLPERQDYNDQTGVNYGEEPSYSEGPLREEADSSYGWKTNPVSNNGWESKPIADEAGRSDGWKTNPASAYDWQSERGKDEAEWSDGWKE